MTIVKTSAVMGPTSVIHTGVGPRNPMGLPNQPTGAKTPPTPPQPMSAAVAYSTPALPGPNTGGYLFLPGRPTQATMGQSPPQVVAPVPSTTRVLPTVVLGGSLYQTGMGSAIKAGANVYNKGPAPTPPSPTTPPNPNYAPGQMPLMKTGSLQGG